MKKYFSLYFLLIVAISSYSQTDSIAPYLRNPVFPEVKLLLPDSVSYFTQNNLPEKKAILFMIFDPACHHCQDEAKDIIKNIDKFKEITILMATPMPFDSMMKFRKAYDLSNYNNIIVAFDPDFFLPKFYRISDIPFLALYDKQRKLIKIFHGPVDIEDVIKGFK